MAKFIPETFPLECSLIENPKTIFGYIRKNFWKFFGWGFIISSLLYIISRAGFSLFMPIQMKMLTNLLDSPHDNFWHAAAIVLGIVLVVNMIFEIAWIMQHYVWQRVRAKARSLLTLDLINYLHCQSMGFINDKMLGKLNQQVNNIAVASLNLLNQIFGNIAMNLVTLVVAMGLVMGLHWSIAVILAAEMLVRLIWFRINFKNIVLTHKRNAAMISQIHGTTTDTIGGSMNVRAFSGREKELGLLSRVLARFRMRYYAHMYANRKFWAPLAVLEALVFSSVMFLCVMYFRGGEMSLGAVVFMVGAYASINGAVWNLLEKSIELFETGTELMQSYNEMNGKISIKDKTDAPALRAARGAIEFENVDFKYDRKSQPVLKNFNLSVGAGEHIGIVGISGSGKTTIIKLLMRLYDTNDGDIKIDGQNIEKVSLDSLRRSIAFIPQDTALFNRTILENLRYACDKATFAQVAQAAKFAGAHEFITQQACGYDTVVGDRGVKLSGGQRQRIAIARAFLQSAPILLVDEATSALDSQTEEIIQRSITKISKGKTMLVVAHRLSTLMQMDRIIVLEDGKIVEMGTHSQLLKKPRGKYARMWKNQSCGFIGQKSN
ncbi:MAG: ABC transporter ATP-binding protein/permease [Alphaproteobacteria bacterium]|nr:ABC transporter ATP-binding protein/permease [Alphaproteobacteria bacterium]